MTRIAFLLLAHKDPQDVIAQAGGLTGSGDHVVIHYDRRAPAAEYRMIREALADNPNVSFPMRRMKCGWGEWSLVAATLEVLRCAISNCPDATHFYLISGDCLPIKSAEYAHAYLEREDCDFIEAVDFMEGDWIKTGIREERLVYRHWFNERRRKWLFYASLDLQQRLGLKRRLPEGLRIMIGSQWWCLRRRTVEALLQVLAQRPDLPAFFRTSWIPDETFFQTLVAHLVPRAQRRSRAPSFLMFTDYGMPATFYNDHYDLLLRQDYLFARKISPEAEDLRRRLYDLWLARGQVFPISDEGPRLFAFLTGQGRVGRRFPTRIWAEDAAARQTRTIHLIAARKWHQAKQLTALIRRHSELPAVDFLFNEEAANLPDLGGISSSLEKRGRHRRALVKLLFEDFGRDRLVLCVDRGALSLIADFAADRGEMRLLTIHCDLDDDYLRGHMRRIGLIHDHTPDAEIARLLPIMRAELDREAESLQDLKLPHAETVSPVMTDQQKAAALSRFLEVSPDVALAIARDLDLR
jgi:hypothetical protein